MFVHIGKAPRRTQLGFVADFCPICRQVRAFRAARVMLVHQVDSIALGRGEQLGNEVTCLHCGVVLRGASPTYATYANQPCDDPFELAAETHPHLAESESEALELEQRASESGLDEAGRASIIWRACLALDYLAQLRQRGESYQPALVYTVSGAMLFTLGALYAWITPIASWSARVPLTVLAAALLASAIYLGLGTKQWWSRKHVYTLLCLALADLAPSRSELAAIHAQLTRRKAMIANFIDVDELAARLSNDVQLRP